MNCEEYKNLITIGVFGKLTHEELTQLKSHLRTCKKCATVYEKVDTLSDLSNQNETIPLPDKEKSWQIISAKAIKKRRSWFGSFVLQKPIIQYSFALLLLIVGFSAGYFFRSDKIKGSQLAQLQQEISQIREITAASLLRQESLNMRLREVGLDTASAMPYGMPLGYLFSTILGGTEEDNALSRTEQTSPLVDIALTLVRQINQSKTY